MRELVAAIETSSLIPVEPGHVAYLRSRVEAAGGDHDAMAAWTVEQGGYLGRTPDYESKALGGSRWTRRVKRGEDFYAVPSAALEA